MGVKAREQIVADMVRLASQKSEVRFDEYGDPYVLTVPEKYRTLGASPRAESLFEEAAYPVGRAGFSAIRDELYTRIPSARSATSVGAMTGFIAGLGLFAAGVADPVMAGVIGSTLGAFMGVIKAQFGASPRPKNDFNQNEIETALNAIRRREGSPSGRQAS